MGAILRQEPRLRTAFVDRGKMRVVLTLRSHDRPLALPRILIVDDYAELRTALRRQLTAENWEVCGEVGNGPDAIEAARRLAPRSHRDGSVHARDDRRGSGTENPRGVPRNVDHADDDAR
jgi:hypothetical protein